MESVAFYCENFNGTLPANCSTTYLYSIGYLDQSKVARLKIGGCDNDKIAQIIADFKNIRSLDISCSNLRSLTLFDVTLEHLRAFNASHNQLTEDPVDIWTKMPRVMDVDFSYNNFKVQSLPQSIIKIDLSHNNMQYIDSYNSTYLPNLEFIDLSHNQLKRIFHQDIFSKAKNLKKLRLEDNQYEYFDGKFLQLLERDVEMHFSWQNIIYFEIQKNIGKPIRVVLNNEEGIWPSTDGNHTEFHCSEGSFDSIFIFSIIDNHIENPSDLLRCLTPSLGRLTLIGEFTEKLSSTSLEPFINLYFLTLNGAKSMEFDLSSIKNANRIYTLDISNNNLKEIRNVSLLKQLPMIYYFNVAGNQLKNTPDLIQYIRGQDSRLYLNGNHVGKLDAITFENVDVGELYLKNTNLSIDDLKPFEPLERLRKLDISFNNLENVNFSVPSTAFKDLVHFSAAHCNITNASELIKLLGLPIASLDLSVNDLKTLNATIFKDFINLQTLNLSRTNLVEIDFGIFRHSNYLQEADFSYNTIQRVSVSSPATYLGILYLDNNQLTDVEPFTTLNFPKLWKMSVSKNQIPCTALAELTLTWPDLKFVDNPSEQRHSDCSSVVRLINNLGFVGTFISKWL
ncbi:toll-like receptor 8 [Sitodiplosis mosellana]|uniref:toll-like receptor 8 n=1 Tax=Sitodiplosis mosellana TaxID=263140 RepID=UPI002443EDD2|nr:toll-like receptor 8 [Sitodiplosis mosellana]